LQSISLLESYPLLILDMMRNLGVKWLLCEWWLLEV